MRPNAGPLAAAFFGFGVDERRTACKQERGINEHQAIVTVLASAAASLPAHGAETWGQALREGDVIVDLRARYESVEQGGFASDADALTNRLRAVSRPRRSKARRFSPRVSSSTISWRTTTARRTASRSIPSSRTPPTFAVINRLALINKSLERTTLTFGRQRIVHDDQRFVGNVGWRQNEQTFDGLRAQWANPKIKTDLTYAAQVNRVFGPESPQGKWEGDVVLANFGYTLPVGHADVVRLLPRHRQSRFGVEQYGRLEARGLEAARQTDRHVCARYSATSRGRREPRRRRRRLRARRRRAQVREVRRGAGARAARRRWRRGVLDAARDAARVSRLGRKFLATPAAGIEDAYVRFTYPLGKRGRFTNVAATAVFHDYEADFGSAHFGEELNLQLVARTERMASDCEVRRLPRGRLVHRHREALVLGRLLVLNAAPNRRVGARGRTTLGRRGAARRLGTRIDADVCEWHSSCKSGTRGAQSRARIEGNEADSRLTARSAVQTGDATLPFFLRPASR